MVGYRLLESHAISSASRLRVLLINRRLFSHKDGIRPVGKQAIRLFLRHLYFGRYLRVTEQ